MESFVHTYKRPSLLSQFPLVLQKVDCSEQDLNSNQDENSQNKEKSESDNEMGDIYQNYEPIFKILKDYSVVLKKKSKVDILNSALFRKEDPFGGSVLDGVYEGEFVYNDQKSREICTYKFTKDKENILLYHITGKNVYFVGLPY